MSYTDENESYDWSGRHVRLRLELSAVSALLFTLAKYFEPGDPFSFLNVNISRIPHSHLLFITSIMWVYLSIHLIVRTFDEGGAVLGFSRRIEKLLDQFRTVRKPLEDVMAAADWAAFPNGVKSFTRSAENLKEAVTQPLVVQNSLSPKLEALRTTLMNISQLNSVSQDSDQVATLADQALRMATAMKKELQNSDTVLADVPKTTMERTQKLITTLTSFGSAANGAKLLAEVQNILALTLASNARLFNDLRRERSLRMAERYVFSLALPLGFAIALFLACIPEIFEAISSVIKLSTPAI